MDYWDSNVSFTTHPKEHRFFNISRELLHLMAGDVALQLHEAEQNRRKRLLCCHWYPAKYHGYED